MNPLQSDCKLSIEVILDFLVGEETNAAAEKDGGECFLAPRRSWLCLPHAYMIDY